MAPVSLLTKSDDSARKLEPAVTRRGAGNIQGTIQHVLSRQSANTPCCSQTCSWTIFGSIEVPMSLSEQIKPISYLKAHAAEILRTLGDRPEPLIITQNGEAKAVVQDIDSYERMQESVALLKMLAMGNRQIEAGQVQPAAEVVARLRDRRRAD